MLARFFETFRSGVFRWIGPLRFISTHPLRRADLQTVTATEIIFKQLWVIDGKDFHQSF